MARGRKAETKRPCFRNIGIEIHRVAECIQFPREIENVEAPGRRDRNTKPSCHHRLITRIVCPEIFAFGLWLDGKANKFEWTRRLEVMIAVTTATRISSRLPSGCNS